MSETKRLEQWQKFPLDSETVQNLRTMLCLQAEDEFSSALWISLGIQKALERCFADFPWSHRDLSHLVRECVGIEEVLRSKMKYIPGERVFLTSENREGIYWSPGPCDKHLVNCGGDCILAFEEEIDFPELAIRESDLNKNIKSVEMAKAPASNKPLAVAGNDPTAAYFSMVDEARESAKETELATSGV